MAGVLDLLWLVPVLPFLAAGVGALLPRQRPRLAAALAIGAMGVALVISWVALGATLIQPSPQGRVWRSFDWLHVGHECITLGWVLDPLTAVMLAMVTLVGFLIFIYSAGYMAHDRNRVRFFCFLSLFAGAMLGLVLANSLLLFFACWELVGLASYLLIGFWFEKPEAAAAARKAFVTTRIGDLGLLLGMVWLYGATGTLTFYDDGRGCLESAALAHLVSAPTLGGIATSTAIGLLLLCGAMGKSGQVPLHVWLPDAMEGPTPVSALIHAATMVAAGVFLVARVYPLMAVVPDGGLGPAPTLQAVTWVGAVTAVFAALVAVAQQDIKRILAYSTVSQLGYMFVGLGVGGVAVGMFHLLTHAFFKALLFLGAGSVIHGCHEEQDIRRMGGLRGWMPVTFATYGVGMLALAGVPVFAGFWSKDEILHAAHGWPVSSVPFYLTLGGALLTAFYMTRQVVLVFFGKYRGAADGAHQGQPPVHESPPVMTVPLLILAGCAVLLGFLGTPFAPWLQSFLGATHTPFSWPGVLGLMLVSTVAVAAGIFGGWWVYGRAPRASAEAPDPLERLQPVVFGWLRRKFFVDELYELTFVRWTMAGAAACQRLDRWVVGMAVSLLAYAAIGVAWASRLFDEYVINASFDAGCNSFRDGGGFLARLQDGRVQHYLRALALGAVTLLLLLTWGCSP